MQRTALIAGATGLVGACLLQLLLQGGRYERVVALVRTATGVVHPRLQEVLTNFSRLADLIDDSTHPLAVNDVFCCLGTTIKRAGAQQEFRKVDYEYPLALATLTQREGASRFSLISAVGANANSAVFYSRIKGELENAILRLDFQDCQFFRPSLLLGDRKQSRPGEWFAGCLAPVFSPLLIGPLEKYRPVPALAVANAMYLAAAERGHGVQYYESGAILRMAAQAGEIK
jgi:uncharacterized protein YbjT (DUF2867 family)